MFARLCLTFHLIEIAAARSRQEIGPVTYVITKDTAERVRGYMREIVAPMLLRAEALMFATQQTDHAAWIAGYILANKRARITARDIIQDYRALRAPEQRRILDSTLDSLCLLGWLEAEESRNLSKPATAWRVNPRVHISFAARAAVERKRRDEVREALIARRQGGTINGRGAC